MNRSALMLLLLATALPAVAAKPCEELKAEITGKLEAKKVAGYTLEIVAAAEVGERKVVGSCEAGSKKIVYSRK
ncbi:MAG: DUF1161 domain-containing protein [Stagnimonas sp.]|nr:DUF1161 domain-containing protein [Stagnimonas sp.]